MFGGTTRWKTRKQVVIQFGWRPRIHFSSFIQGTRFTQLHLRRNQIRKCQIDNGRSSPRCSLSSLFSFLLVYNNCYSFLCPCSGSTGKPKGVLHTTAGYLIYAATTFKYVFDYHPGDIYWCTADCGWITGHTYVVYGPLANGATSVIVRMHFPHSHVNHSSLSASLLSVICTHG